MINDKQLSYLDFRKAALRNIHACKVLLEQSKNENVPARKQQLLHKVFYLGGYIIEFSYKFALFSHLNLQEKDNVNKFKDEVFRKKWQVHDFKALASLCENEKLKFSQDIPFLGNNILNKDIKELIEGWDVQIRYSLGLGKKTISLKEEILKDYIKIIIEINTKINDKYS